MEHIVEVVLELLFGAKNNPDKMPEIEYKSEFKVKWSSARTIARIVGTLIIIVVFAVLWIIFNREVKFLGIAMSILVVAAFIFAMIYYSHGVYVTENYLKRSFGLFKKAVNWNDVSCLRLVEQTDKKDVVIAIYDNNGKCVIDVISEMENAWYIVKMAEHKGIEIKQEKDLSIKELSHL